MRKDMSHKLSEGPTRGGGMPPGDPDKRTKMSEKPSKERMQRPWRKSEYKKNYGNPAVLKRWLKSKVGKPWDKVYSEICEAIPDRGDGVRDRVEWFVELHAQIVIGKKGQKIPCYKTGCRYLHRETSIRVGELYVCPNSGLLKEVRPPKHPQKKEENPREVIFTNDNYTQYRKIEGIWYEVKLSDLPDRDDSRPWWRRGLNGPSVYDTVFGENLGSLSRSEIIRTYGDQLYAVGKRQLNSSEIKRIMKAIK